jgi:hypothetical protein
MKQRLRGLEYPSRVARIRAWKSLLREVEEVFKVFKVWGPRVPPY